MTKTPEEIARWIVSGVLFLNDTQSPCLIRAITAAIQAERDDADRRVAELRRQLEIRLQDEAFNRARTGG